MFDYKANTCPLMRGPCIESKCKFWVHLLGKNPQSDSTVDRFDCAVSWLPILLIENAQTVRQVAASTDKVANQVNQGNQVLEQARIDAARRLEMLPNGSD